MNNNGKSYYTYLPILLKYFINDQHDNSTITNVNTNNIEIMYVFMCTRVYIAMRHA